MIVHLAGPRQGPRPGRAAPRRARKSSDGDERAGVGPRHPHTIVLASSREVYGQQPRDGGPVPESAAVFGASPSPYAAAKLASEALAAAYHGCYGLPYLVFRFSNVYGRYDNDLHRLERVLWIFTRAIRRGEPLTVYGAEKLLDFTYVTTPLTACGAASNDSSAAPSPGRRSTSPTAQETDSRPWQRS